MMGEEMMVPQCETKVTDYIPPTIREQLMHQREGLLKKVEQIDEALKLMDGAPDYERVHDAIVRVQRNGGLR